MYAIVRIAGGQYQAEIGKHIVTEKLPHPEGEALTFDDVLLVA
ncbi:MAG: bL21 family ribosomal protein, partial [Anaerolineae bacterium]|nr:bL21 family ribosomal protein [Anaerolineae bacterium]